MRTVNWANWAYSILAILFCSLSLYAQEWDEGFTNDELYQLEYFKFEPDKTAEAIIFLNDYFIMANRVAGFPDPVMELVLDSADYDLLVLWQYEEGSDNLNWQTCPTNNNWYSAFVTVAGNEEKAKEIIERFDSYIITSQTEIAKKK